jgi:uncharacterized protein (TIGR03435 family)
MSAIRVCAGVLLAAAVWAQTTPPRPEFEVASIKPSPPQMPNQAAIGIHIDGAQVRCAFLPLRDYLAMAYHVKVNQIVGPDWMNTERFDIAAKIPAGGSAEHIREMLQTLLEARFRMKIRHEQKEFPVYGLLAAKGGLKMQPLPPDPEEANRRAVDVTASGGAGGVNLSFGNGASFSLAGGKFDITRLTMEDFAQALTRFADRPVIDMTNSPARYTFTVDLTPEDYRAILIRSAVNAGVTLPPEALRALEGFTGESTFIALQTVGLKLESRKAPLPVVIIDSISKSPTEN